MYISLYICKGVGLALHSGKGKGKGRALDIAPQVTNLRGAQVHGAHKAASHVPALYLPSYSRYSFTDPETPERMED